MRKFFLFFAAMLVALTASAKTINITNETAGSLKATIDTAKAGDVIVLAGGVYSETSTIQIKKPIKLMAKEGAKPEVDPSGYIQLYSSVEVEGIKFNGVNANEHCFYIYPDSVRYFKIDGCEICNYPKYGISANTNPNHVDSVFINNCYFHDNGRAAVYFPTSTESGGKHVCNFVSITNSTFANFTALNTWAIEVNNNAGSDALKYDTSVKLVVDHCTFYNCTRGSYGPIRAYYSNNVHITNCIFAEAASTTTKATYCYGGNVAGSTSEINHCLTFNNGGHHSGPTIDATTNISEDPQFCDAANGDFCLKAASPAIGAGTDKSNLGDPRWGVAKTLYCKMEHSWWTADGAAVACYAKVDGGEEMSSWPGTKMTSLGDNMWEIEIPAKYEKINFTRVKADGSEYWGAKTAELDVPVYSNFYTITSADAQWDSESNTAQGTWSVKDAKYYIAGSYNSWNTDDKIGSTTDEYVMSLAAGNHQIKVVGKGWYGLSNLTAVAQGLYPDQDGNVCFTLAEAGDVTINFVEAEEITTFTVAGTFALPSVKLIGEGAAFGAWNAEDAVAFTPDEGNLTASHTFTLAAGEYEFKMIRAGEWLTKEGEDGQHNPTTYGLHREWTSVSGFYRDDYNYALKITADVAGNYKFTWTYATGTLDITFPSNDPTAIDATAVEGQAVKFIQNGQLLILRDGKTYNVLGATVK